MPARDDARAYLPLSNLTFHVLLALSRESPSHGYAIGKEVHRRSEGRLDPTTGALYQALKRLAEDGLIEHAAPPDGASADARRKYFRLSALGRAVAAAEAERLNGLVTAARHQKLFAGPA